MTRITVEEKERGSEEVELGDYYREEGGEVYVVVPCGYGNYVLAGLNGSYWDQARTLAGLAERIKGGGLKKFYGEITITVS